MVSQVSLRVFDGNKNRLIFSTQRFLNFDLLLFFGLQCPLLLCLVVRFLSNSEPVALSGHHIAVGTAWLLNPSLRILEQIHPSLDG